MLVEAKNSTSNGHLENYTATKIDNPKEFIKIYPKGDNSTLNQQENVDFHASLLYYDSICSGESIIKAFSFKTPKYEKDAAKCIMFWEAMKEQKNINPVECTVLDFISKQSLISTNMRRKTQKTWLETLMMMKTLKMEETAFAAIPKQCILCNYDSLYALYKKRTGRCYLEWQLKDDEDITCLNSWVPISIEANRLREKRQKLTVKPSLQVPEVDLCCTTCSCIGLCLCGTRTLENQAMSDVAPLEIEVLYEEKEVLLEEKEVLLEENEEVKISPVLVSQETQCSNREDEFKIETAEFLTELQFRLTAGKIDKSCLTDQQKDISSPIVELCKICGRHCNKHKRLSQDTPKKQITPPSDRNKKLTEPSPETRKRLSKEYQHLTRVNISNVNKTTHLSQQNTPKNVELLKNMHRKTEETKIQPSLTCIELKLENYSSGISNSESDISTSIDFDKSLKWYSSKEFDEEINR